MRTSRRRFVATAGLGSIGLLAGCQEMVTGDGIELTAQEPRVADEAVDESIYELQALESYEIDEEFSVAGETRTVEASSWVATYTISIDAIEEFHDDPQAAQETIDEIEDADVAAFSVLSTPSEEVAGQEVNPVVHLTNEDLIDEVGDEISEGRLEDVEQEDEYTQSILGEETTIDVLSATAIADTPETDEEYPIYLHMGEVAHEDDILIVAGIHHEALDEREQFSIFMENIEHPV